MDTLNDAKRVTDRKHYDGFDLMPIAGRWRKGRSVKRIGAGMTHVNDIPVVERRLHGHGKKRQGKSKSDG